MPNKFPLRLLNTHRCMDLSDARKLGRLQAESANLEQLGAGPLHGNDCLQRFAAKKRTAIASRLA